MVEVNKFVQLMYDVPKKCGGTIKDYSCKGTASGNLQMIRKSSDEVVAEIDIKLGTLIETNKNIPERPLTAGLREE